MPHDVQGLLTVSFAGRVGAVAQGGGTNDMQRLREFGTEKAKGLRSPINCLHGFYGPGILNLVPYCTNRIAR